MRLEDLVFDAGRPLRVVDDDGTHAHHEIVGTASAVRRCLNDSGAPPEGTVALLAENGAGFVAGLAGILAAGATAVLVDPGLPAAGVHRIVLATRVSHVCCAGRRPTHLVAEHRAEFSALRVLEIEAVPRAAVRGLVASQRSPRSPDQAAVVLYSSGTTGQPKGIVLSHRAILANVQAIAEYLRPSSDDTFYIAKSMVHSSTLVGEVLLTWWSGAQLLALNPLASPTQLFRRIREHRPTIICVNPSLLHFFAGQSATVESLRSLHTIHVSGAIVDSGTFQTVHERFPWIRMINGYGLSEAGPRVAQLSTTTALKPRSVGKPIKGVSVDVRRADQMSCGPREIGEIYVRSPSLFEGYLDRNGLVAPALHDGALGTGDLGYLDEDGELFITGRLDDLIITGGHNVDPREIEEVLVDVTGVRDCIVFGVDDRLLGQRVVCAYTTDSTRLKEHIRLEQRMRETCARTLADYQMPKTFRLWHDIPLSSGGKKSRSSARERFLEGDEP